MRKRKSSDVQTAEERGRVLARALADGLENAHGGFRGELIAYAVTDPPPGRDLTHIGSDSI